VILEVQHTTTIRYRVPVLRSMNIVRMAPQNTASQRRLRFALEVQPPASISSYVDHWGNEAHTFTVRRAHSELVVRAWGRAETTRQMHPTESVPWDAYRPDALGSLLDFTLPTPLTTLERLSWPEDGTEDAWSWITMTIASLPDRLRYRKGTTRVDTPAAEVIARGEGVCQDFAHVALGLLRRRGLPARYVSGYQYVGETARHEPHAWVEVWHPNGGWVGFDPTAGQPTDERYVKTAVGRDYTEAAPLRGHLVTASPEPAHSSDPPQVEVRITALASDDVPFPAIPAMVKG